MFMFLKKFLSEEEFHDNFNNLEWVNKTLICFSVEDQTPLWKLWGYSYNNPKVEHAEIFVLREISKFVESNPPKKHMQYNVTLYTSYSPCLTCSEEMCTFLKNFKSKLNINLNVSKFYKFHEYDNKRSLKNLKNCGVEIKVMDLEAYKTCFYLFVNPSDIYKPCEELNSLILQNKSELDDLWSEEFNDNIFKTNEENLETFDSEEQFTSHSNKALTRFQNDIATPKANEREKGTLTGTPTKIHPKKEEDQHRGFKRKLSFN